MTGCLDLFRSMMYARVVGRAGGRGGSLVEYGGVEVSVSSTGAWYGMSEAFFLCKLVVQVHGYGRRAQGNRTGLGGHSLLYTHCCLDCGNEVAWRREALDVIGRGVHACATTR